MVVRSPICREGRESGGSVLRARVPTCPLILQTFTLLWVPWLGTIWLLEISQ